MAYLQRFAMASANCRQVLLVWSDGQLFSHHLVGNAKQDALHRWGSTLLLNQHKRANEPCINDALKPR